MNCLQCPSCFQPFSHDLNKSQSIPRVLLSCGHTFCHSCLEKSFRNNEIICFQCQKISQSAHINLFPVNETLLSMIKTTRQTQQRLCKVHKKKLEAYCDKDKQLICVQCTLNTHRLHKAYLISQKAFTDRNTIKDSHIRIAQSLQENKRVMDKLMSEERGLQHSFYDYQMEINIFYKNIMEEITILQNKEIERAKNQRQDIMKKIVAFKNEVSEKIDFYQQLEAIYSEITALSDVEFILQETKRAFILQNCKNKKGNYQLKTLQFKRINSLQQIASSIQEMTNFQKKRMLHSNSMQANPNNNSLIGQSPNVKKSLNKQPAVLQVNLSEQYNKRKINSKPQQKKIKPTKKIISIVGQKQKERIIEAVSTGRTISISQKQSKDPKAELKYIRQSSIKKNRDMIDCSLNDDMQFSNNYTPMSSIHSFMRTSRESEINQTYLNQTSFKNTYAQFSLLDLEEKVYHFGGMGPHQIQRYFGEHNQSKLLGGALNKKSSQCIYFKSYHRQKCLIIGGSHYNRLYVTDTGNEVHEFNFKTEKLTKTNLQLTHGRDSFGCIVKNDNFFIFGGKFDKSPLNTFQKYSYINNKLVSTKMPNLTQARQDFGFCLGFDDHLYIAGGVNTSGSILNSCQRFNWQKMSWQTVAHMKYQRRGFVLIAVPHGIFAIGGHSSADFLSKVQLYDYQKKKWMEMTPMNQARAFHTATVAKDYSVITVYGGFHSNNHLDSIEQYHIEQNRWYSHSQMAQSRCQHTTILAPI